MNFDVSNDIIGKFHKSVSSATTFVSDMNYLQLLRAEVLVARLRNTVSSAQKLSLANVEENPQSTSTIQTGNRGPPRKRRRVKVNCDKIDHCEKLPDELILHIFWYLPRELVCWTLPLVSRRWRHLSRDPSLFRRLDCSYMNFTEMANISVAPILLFLSNVKPRELSLSNDPFLGDTNERILQGLPSVLPELRQLRLQSTKVTRDSIRRLVESNSHLIRLELQDFNNLNCDIIREICQNLPHLQHLSLKDCAEVCDVCVIHVAQSVRCLRSINLRNVDAVTDRGVKELLTKHREHLEVVHLQVRTATGQQLTSSSVECLSQCPQLHTLQIDSLDEDGLQVLHGLSQLRQLHCSTMGRILPGTMKYILDNLQELRHFSVISMCQLGTRAMKRCSRYLQTVKLYECGSVTDETLQGLFHRCPDLVALDVQGCRRLTGQCFLKHDLKQVAPNLGYINVHSCTKIDESVLQLMKNRYPSIMLIDDNTVFNFETNRRIRQRFYSLLNDCDVHALYLIWCRSSIKITAYM